MLDEALVYVAPGRMCLGLVGSRWGGRFLGSGPLRAGWVSRPSRPPSRRTGTATARSSPSPRTRHSWQPVECGSTGGWPRRVAHGEAGRGLPVVVVPGIGPRSGLRCRSGCLESKCFWGERGNGQFEQADHLRLMADRLGGLDRARWTSGIRLAVWLSVQQARSGGERDGAYASCATSSPWPRSCTSAGRPPGSTSSSRR